MKALRSLKDMMDLMSLMSLMALMALMALAWGRSAIGVSPSHRSVIGDSLQSRR